MRKTVKRIFALLLVCLQIALLLPAAAAADKGKETPRLNETILGTVQFDTFNFTTGDSETGMEGADYVMPFVYTDDYFARPACTGAPAAKTLDWTALEDKSLATASLDFTMACFGSNERVLAMDYSDYSKTGKKFLSDCGFTDIVENDVSPVDGDVLTQENRYNAFPTRDSIGVIVGSKEITVWNGERNETFTLIAVGIRGAGYGAEWASNLTLGDGTQSAEHEGFRLATEKIKLTLDAYVKEHAAEHMKYWVCGYSRSGAMANLLAADITDSAERYHTAPKDVYGYTYESAAAADRAQDPDGKRYPNIHNIMSRMDLVPRISMAEFGNGRLGVDYLTPYHGNADAQTNDAYYRLMYRILPTVAQGYGGETDPAVVNADPAKFPYQNPVKLYYVSLWDFATTQSLDGGLQEYIAKTPSPMNPTASPWKGQPIPNAEAADLGNPDGKNYVMYLDTFLDDFASAFVNSRAWDFDIFNPRPAGGIVNQGALKHRENFVKNGYQDAFRHLVGLALGTPGGKLADMFGNLTGALASSWADLLGFANALMGTGGYDRVPTEAVAQDASASVRAILLNMLNGSAAFEAKDGEALYSSNYTFSRKTGEVIDTLAPVLTRLYLYDRSEYGSQYLGTLLKYAGDTIIVAHTPELNVSWQMAMDENFTADYRTVTLPKATDVKLYAFRGEFFGEQMDYGAPASVAAEFRDGALVQSLDNRIKKTGETLSTFTIRYPGTMDVRFDITALPDEGFNSADVTLADFAPQDGVNAKAVYDRAKNGNIIQDSVRLAPDAEVLQQDDSASAAAVNQDLRAQALTVGAGETLQILAKHGSNSVESPFEADYAFRKAPSPKPVPAKLPFTDVAASDWFYGDVQYCFENGLMNGMTPDTFAPQGTTTRAQFATVLYRMAGSPDVKGKVSPFSDVAAGAWYENAVIWGSEQGVIRGTSETTFTPEAPVTREQMVTMLWRYAGEDKAEGALGQFTDADHVSDYALPAMRWAVQRGIVSGMGDGTLHPQGSATRAQLAKILHVYETL